MPEEKPAQSRYRILGALHRGGMGEILLARAEGADGFARKFVLKGLLPQLVDDEVSADLFRREAKLMSRLLHPNIVQVVDFAYVDGRPYLAMEYVRGRNLHQVIQRANVLGGPLSLPIAAYVLSEALRGLHYAHRARDEQGRPLGIVHRDISPGNILVSFFGEVKVTDFGIAMADGMAKHTGPRSIRGKARYTAPEIIAGKSASVQSDLYAAGVVLAESLMGAPLWDKGQLPETLLAIVSEALEDTLRRIGERVPLSAGLAEVFRRSLNRRPEERYATAEDMADALDRVSREGGLTIGSAALGAYARSLFKKAPNPDEERTVRIPSVVGPPPRSEPPTAGARPTSLGLGERPIPEVAAVLREPSIPPPGLRATSSARPARLQCRPPTLSERKLSPSPKVDVAQIQFLSSSPRSDSPGSPSPALLQEFVDLPSSTDAEPSRPLPDEPLPRVLTSKWHNPTYPPWVLLLIGVLIGGAAAATAVILVALKG